MRLNNVSSSISAFQWSTSEQVYALEKAKDGSDLYAKVINFGALPNNGYRLVAHGIAGFKNRNQYRYSATVNRTDATDQGYLLPLVDSSTTYQSQVYFDATNIQVTTFATWATWNDVRIYMIYSKEA